MSTPPPVPPPLRAKARPLLLWLFLGAALLGVLALGLIPGFYLVEKHRGRAAWRAYETAAKARGVLLDFAAYIPPEIPDAENFASIPIFDAAFRASDAKEEVPDPLKLPEAKDGELPKFADMAKQQRIDLAEWQQYFVEAGLLPAAGENAAADVLLALEKFAAPLAQIDEMLARFEPTQRRWFGERPIPSSPKNITDMPTKIRLLFFALAGPVFEECETKFIQAATFTDLARLACALERCRLARGAFPPALSELTPDFLATVPAEIVNGEPYRYRRADDGRFVLYSTGPDLRDDGGVIDPKKSAREQADLVWGYPK